MIDRRDLTIIVLIGLLCTVTVFRISISSMNESESYPTVPCPADSMWIDPPAISLNTVGSKFNVTVWLNLTVYSTVWQFRMIYNKQQLDALRCQYTAAGKSQFFANISTIPVSPVFGVYNASHNSVIHGEAASYGSYRAPGYGSLAWVEFEVLVVPLGGEKILDISTEYPVDTYALDDVGSKIPLQVQDCIRQSTPEHDVAVTDVAVSETDILRGEIVNVMVAVRNEGTFTESFNVTAYHDSVPIGTQLVSDLPSRNQTELTFFWNTASVASGSYTLSAEAHILPAEIDTTDNTFINGDVTIYDTTLLKVEPSHTLVDHAGQIFNVSVCVDNIYAFQRLFGLEFSLSYDPAVMQVLGVTEGSFFNPFAPDGTDFDWFDDGSSIDVIVFPNGTGYSPFPEGSGTVVTITFNASTSVSNPLAQNITLTLYDTILVDAGFIPIFHDVIHGEVEMEISEHDIAVVSVAVSDTEVFDGQLVNVTVVAKNVGWATETFNVTAYYNAEKIGEQTAENLPPGNQTELTFMWNTTDVPSTTYTISAEADTVPGEVYNANNGFVDGDVTVHRLHILWTPTCPHPFVPSSVPRDGEPVNVTADIQFNGSIPAKALFFYRAAGGEWWNTTMVYNDTNGLWTTTIPGQRGNVTVAFYIETYKGGDIVTTPTYVFQVQDLFDSDVNGDGKVRIDDILMVALEFGLG
ncbi:MAG: cohesin domain-containing protein [Candidatus Bathyarchaeota archaeon]|nr:cohesin domain-containing protein [Candidatus Bathyarchaeota archaeon]